MFASSCQRRLPVRSPFERGRVRRRPRSLASMCSTRFSASSAKRSALAKPTSSREVAQLGQDLAQDVPGGGERLGRRRNKCREPSFMIQEIAPFQCHARSSIGEKIPLIMIKMP